MRLPLLSPLLDKRALLVAVLFVVLAGYTVRIASIHAAIGMGREALERRVGWLRELNETESAIHTAAPGSPAPTLALRADELVALGRELAEFGREADDRAAEVSLTLAAGEVTAGRLVAAEEAVHLAERLTRNGTATLSSRLGDLIDEKGRAAIGGLFFGFVGVAALAASLVALRSSEAWRRRWTLSSQATSDGQWEWDLVSGAVTYSPRWLEFTGANGAVIEVLYARVHPTDLPGLRARLDAHLAGTSPTFDAEFQLQDWRSRWRWILARGLAERDGDRATRFVCWQTDITDRRVGADAAERVALIEHVVDATCMGVIAVDDSEVVWQQNRAAEAMGKPWGGVDGFWQALGNEAEAPTLTPCGECGDPERHGTRIVVTRSPAGQQRVFQLTWTGHGHRLIPGRVVTVALVADVTLRSRAEEDVRVAHARLVAAEAELRAAFDAVPAVVVLVRDQRVLFANREAVGVLGTGAGALEALGRAPEAGLGSSPRVVRREGAADVSYEVFRAVPVAFEGAPADLIVAVDVTRRVRAESQLRTAERMLALGGLAAGLAHEINNPLTYVIGNLELAQEGVGDPADRISRALGGAVRVRQVVAQLRTLANRGQIEREAVSVGEVVEGALTLAAGVGLPQAQVERAWPPGLQVAGSAVWLGQIILNLCTNAQLAMATREPADRRLRVEARLDREAVTIEVSDTGTGVPASIQATIFDPFVSTRLRGEGSGLGLYICRELAQRMGAELTLARTSEAGTAFALRVPLAESVGAAMPPVCAPAPVPFARGRVLVVDDEPGLGDVLRSYVAAHDVTVETDADGARVSLQDAGWDVVILDIVLPTDSGIALYDELESRDSPLCERVLFVSGGSMTPDVAKFMLATSRPVLLKPFDFRELVELVERGVSDRRAQES